MTLPVTFMQCISQALHYTAVLPAPFVFYITLYTTTKILTPSSALRLSKLSIRYSSYFAGGLRRYYDTFKEPNEQEATCKWACYCITLPTRETKDTTKMLACVYGFKIWTYQPPIFNKDGMTSICNSFRNSPLHKVLITPCIYISIYSYQK